MSDDVIIGPAVTSYPVHEKSNRTITITTQHADSTNDYDGCHINQPARKMGGGGDDAR